MKELVSIWRRSLRRQRGGPEHRGGFSTTAKEGLAVIVEFIDNVTGTAVYINPAYVVSLRPDPADPADVTLVKLEDGETIRVRGNHRDVADKLTSRTS
jgi:hypothetical protein